VLPCQPSLLCRLSSPTIICRCPCLSSSPFICLLPCIYLFFHYYMSSPTLCVLFVSICQSCMFFFLAPNCRTNTSSVSLLTITLHKSSYASAHMALNCILPSLTHPPSPCCVQASSILVAHPLPVARLPSPPFFAGCRGESAFPISCWPPIAGCGSFWVVNMAPHSPLGLLGWRSHSQYITVMLVE
jgi:hypothetical protein